ncbi:MAG TPA: hypothetical protein VK674_03935 [Candidatus Limnocylindria bacterium]|nr:hypothetical protein [Candidatus Limnocylindria bacterium]
MAHQQIVVVDENDQPVGVFPKEEVWAKGLSHRIVHIMLEDDQGNLLLQKRSMQMDTAPGCWDHAAAWMKSNNSSVATPTKLPMVLRWLWTGTIRQGV